MLFFVETRDDKSICFCCCIDLGLAVGRQVQSPFQDFEILQEIMGPPTERSQAVRPAEVLQKRARKAWFALQTLRKQDPKLHRCCRYVALKHFVHQMHIDL